MVKRNMRAWEFSLSICTAARSLTRSTLEMVTLLQTVGVILISKPVPTSCSTFFFLLKIWAWDTYPLKM